MRKQCIEIANRIFGVLVGELTVFAAISNFISTVQKMSKTSTTCISQPKLGYAVVSIPKSQWFQKESSFLLIIHVNNRPAGGSHH